MIVVEEERVIILLEKGGRREEISRWDFSSPFSSYVYLVRKGEYIRGSLKGTSFILFFPEVCEVEGLLSFIPVLTALLYPAQIFTFFDILYSFLS